MSDFICISCWSSFQVPEATVGRQGGSVTCPQCGFAQDADGSRAQQAPGSDAVLEEAAKTTQMPMSAEVLAMALEQASRTRESDSGPSTRQGRGVSAHFAVPSDDDDELDGDEPTRIGSPAFALDDEPEPGAPTQGLDLHSALEELGGGGVGFAMGTDGGQAELVDANLPPHPWQLLTASGLVLHFPTLRLLIEFAGGLNAASLRIAKTGDRWRDYAVFAAQLSPRHDPADIYAQTPLSDDAAHETAAPPPEVPVDESGNPLYDDPFAESMTSRPVEQPKLKGPLTRASEESGQPLAAREASHSGPRPLPDASDERRKRMATEFQFRTQQQTNPWPTRITFFLLGAILSGAGIYYLAWLGALPGLQY